MSSPLKIDADAIETFLSRGIENVFPNRAFLESLLSSGKQLTVYLGIDPTGPTLHLGHLIPLLRLRALQRMGHRVILLIGDFTAMIGDPTDKSAARVRLSREEVLRNAASYKKQAGLFLSFEGENAAELRYNSEWLAKMSFEEVLELTAQTTVQRMLERDMFEKRMEDGKPIYLNEFLYPLMQGYDSVAMEVDGEIGGNDQTFNMLMGRTLLKDLKQKEKFVLTTKLLTDAEGKKMGKTEGNMVALEDAPDEMFGKIMSWTDSMIIPAFELVTETPIEEVRTLSRALSRDEVNPRDAKEQLARAVVSLFYGEEKAAEAAEGFRDLFVRGEVPEDVPVHRVESASLSLLEALMASGLVSSKMEARRQVEQGGVKVDGEVVKDIQYLLSGSTLVQKGKRHFVRIVCT